MKKNWKEKWFKLILIMCHCRRSGIWSRLINKTRRRPSRCKALFSKCRNNNLQDPSINNRCCKPNFVELCTIQSLRNRLLIFLSKMLCNMTALCYLRRRWHRKCLSSLLTYLMSLPRSTASIIKVNLSSSLYSGSNTMLMMMYQERWEIQEWMQKETK